MNATTHRTQAAGLTHDEKASSLEGSLPRAVQIGITNRALRSIGFLVGSVGATIGVLGMACATVVTLTWQPADPVYIQQNPTTGELASTARPLNATQDFTTGTVRQHLRAYIDYCETYRYQTLNETTRRCQLFLSPPQKLEFSKLYDATNAESPLRRLGRDGTMNVADNVTMQEVTRGRDGVQVWGLRFTKVLAEQGKAPVCTPWSAVVTFQWRPDLKMTDADRDINLGGMQIIGRSTGPDSVRVGGC